MVVMRAPDVRAACPTKEHRVQPSVALTLLSTCPAAQVTARPLGDQTAEHPAVSVKDVPDRAGEASEHHVGPAGKGDQYCAGFLLRQLLRTVHQAGEVGIDAQGGCPGDVLSGTGVSADALAPTPPVDLTQLGWTSS